MESDLEVIKFVFATVARGYPDINDLARELFEEGCPLPGVIFLKNTELTKLMLNLGCSVNDRFIESKETALHLAVQLSDIANVKVLVDHGVDVNVTDSEGYTPLNRFEMHPRDGDEKLDILRLLLDQGASFVTSTNDDESAFISRMLIEGDSRTISVLLSYIDLSRTYENEIYPLHDLAINKDEDVIDLLLGIDLDVEARDSLERSPLDWAVHFSNVGMVQFFLEKGAKPNLHHEVYSLLQICIVEGLEIEKTRKIIELLLHYGANPQLLWGNNYISFLTEEEDKFVMVQPILAQLAMAECIGVPLNKYVCKNIETNRVTKNYFVNCKKQIELMKQTIVYESVTMYSLLFECKEKIEIYSRNQEFASNYDLLVNNNKCNVDPYYLGTIHFRVDKTLNLVQTKVKVACIVCEIIMNLPYSMIGVIGHEIVNYLQREDLENVLQI